MTTAPWDNATFQLVDPHALLIDHNRRTIGDLTTDDPDFVASIKLNGVRIPIIACPTEDGRLRVKDGGRRTIAAILADHPTIPAIITHPADAENWMWLVDHWIANEVRAGFTGALPAPVDGDLSRWGTGGSVAMLSIRSQGIRAWPGSRR